MEVVVETQQEVVAVELWVGIVVRPKVEWWLIGLWMQQWFQSYVVVQG